MTLDDRDLLKQLFGATTECQAVESLAVRGPIESAAIQAHLGSCAHCAAQRAAYVAFLEPAPCAADAFAVNWVDNRMRMPWNRDATPRASWFDRLFGTRALAPAAIALAALLLTVGVGVRSRSSVPSTQDLLQSAERSQNVELIAPKGDVARAPEELRWGAVAGAAQYRVKIMEVDRVLLWQATTASLNVRVPLDVQGKSLPGKRMIWQVEALDAGGKELAQSSQSFRKKLAPTH
ncbi:hypothetical protein [Paludibaculum fermentans]|uniref:Uncharacterized protein n=1 Tax=Paludibaculum fermentans TaxID=1473598 RepID=A0A7S7SKC1_PALFE|nr:hypothetical protein [Paludibaculum fermentans]QOY88149.1 hypothetical protein IRI77_36345 [Paludibaculum fermentans]